MISIDRKFESNEDDTIGDGCAATEYLDELLLQQRDSILDCSTGWSYNH